MEQVKFDAKYSEEKGSFEIIGYDENKAKLEEYLSKIADKPLILTDVDCKSVRKTRADLNKLITLVSSGRKSSVKLISAQYKEIEKMLQDKADNLTSAINDYVASQKTDEEPQTEKACVLIIKGSREELIKVQEYAKSLGLEGDIK